MSTVITSKLHAAALASIEKFSARRQEQLWQESADARTNHIDRLKAMVRKGLTHELWRIADMVSDTLMVTTASGVPVILLPIETRQVLIAAHYAGMINDYTVGLLQWDGPDFMSLLRQPEEQRVDLAALQAAQEYEAMQTIDDLTGKI